MTWQFGASVLVAIVVMTLQATPDEPKPFFDAKAPQSRSTDSPEDADAPPRVKEVRIGYFGPPEPTDSRYGTLWKAAQWAITEANRQGGYRGLPFRLVPAWSDNPWGTGIADLARLVYQDHVWAIIGGVDGPSTHLAEQVVAKARLPLIGPVSTDRSVNLANVPWMFSIAPSDRAIADALASGIVQCCEPDKLILVSANDHDSHMLAAELRKSLSRLAATPAWDFEFSGGAAPLRPLVQQILKRPLSGIIVIAGPRHSARLVTLFRDNGYHKRIFAGPAASRPAFRSSGAKIAEGVIVPLLASSASTNHARATNAAIDTTVDASKQIECLLSDGDFASVQTYDAVRIAIKAIRHAGLNRANIGQAIRESAPYRGLSGPIVWNRLGRNQRPAALAIIRDGQLVPVLTVEKASGLISW